MALAAKFDAHTYRAKCRQLVQLEAANFIRKNIQEAAISSKKAYLGQVCSDKPRQVPYYFFKILCMSSYDQLCPHISPFILLLIFIQKRENGYAICKIFEIFII